MRGLHVQPHRYIGVSYASGKMVESPVFSTYTAMVKWLDNHAKEYERKN